MLAGRSRFRILGCTPFSVLCFGFQNVKTPRSDGYSASHNWLKKGYKNLVVYQKLWDNPYQVLHRLFFFWQVLPIAFGNMLHMQFPIDSGRDMGAFKITAP